VHVRDLFISENAFRKPDAEASDASWESARKAMDLAWEELQGGAVFDEAFVTKHSTDARRKAAGGDLGWLTLDNAQFAGLRDRALLLEKDALTEPFRTRHGFHILHVMDRKYAYSLEKAMETPNVRKRVLGKFVVFGKNAARQVERSRHDVKIHLSF
jgi:peptidyl-prolyl cis-trans isomerase SurA